MGQEVRELRAFPACTASMCAITKISISITNLISSPISNSLLVSLLLHSPRYAV